MMIQKIHELKLWGKRPFYLGGCVFLLSALFCVIRIILPCKEYQYEGGYDFKETAENSSVAVYEGISLPPGVYRVELEYDTDTDFAGLCNIADGTVFSGGLNTNGEHLYSALGKTGFCVWLYEKTDSLQVQVDYAGKGCLTTGDLKIFETNQFWTMLLTVILSAWLMFGISLTFYYYDKKYRISFEIKNVIFFVGVISLIASVPYLSGYMITGPDLTYHLQRIEGVKDGLLGGQFPVRLEPRWLYDHGYASAVFYCNAFLYFPALLRMLGFPIIVSYNIYCIVFNVATAWIAYYCFSRIFKNWQVGTICSALYTLSVIRIYKTLTMSAVGEGNAYTFLPLVIYGLYRIFTEDILKPKYRSAWISLMFGFAGLIQTHVLTCEVTALVTILFCFANRKKVFQKNTFLELVKGAAGAALVSLWFLVPFLDYYLTQNIRIKNASARTIQEQGIYPAHLLFHFWKKGSNTPAAGAGIQNSQPIGIGPVLMIALGIFLILWFFGYFAKAKETRVDFAKKTAIITMLLLFMSTNVFPWDRIQKAGAVAAALVSSLQFPNRFLGWCTVCLVFLFGYCLCYFKKKDNRIYLIMAAMAFIGVTTSDMHLLDYANGGYNTFILYNEESMGFGYISGAEYLIMGTEPEKLIYTDAVAGEGVEIQSCEKGYLQAKVRCVNRKEKSSFIDIPFLSYKGFHAVNANTGDPLEISAGENNVIRVRIPPGFDGSLKVFFKGPVYWRVSEWVSAGTVIVWLVMWMRYQRREHEEET